MRNTNAFVTFSVVCAVFGVSVCASGCDALAPADTASPTLPADASVPGDATTPPPDGAATDAGAPSDSGAPTGDAGPEASFPPDADLGPCSVTFRYAAPSGQTPTSVEVRGEWNDFGTPGVTLTLDASGAYTGKTDLEPGLWGYKIVSNGTDWELDPGSGLRKYVGGTENSAVRVAECHVPKLVLASKKIDRAAAGQGHFAGVVTYADGVLGAGLDAASVKGTLVKDGASSPLAGVSAAPNGTSITVDAPGLADGKYTIFVDASDKAGRPAPRLRLVFWIEAETFDWHDAVIYMVMTDRFKDADTSNDVGPTAGVDPRADFKNGDLEGVRQAIAKGTFDALGIRALWLSPFHTNPTTPYAAADGVHTVTGYHGYWPVKARQVEPRLGGEKALHALVQEAHAHGIRVLQDFVVNHVHQNHEYYQAHPQWFRTGCICGTNNCDWTTHRLDCLFADYLPDVNWTITPVSEQYGDDMVWWLDQFDLDGLRIDAVKHVEDLAIMNSSARIRDEFEAAGTRVFLTGETAMGWSDCGLACNADQYGTIARYIGPFGLDGQTDFVLYHGVAYRTFAYDQKGMIHADYWAQQSQTQYPAGAIMTPFIGSQDAARFVTLSSYRGQDAAHDMGIPGNQWDNVAAAPPDAEPYARHQLALTWLLSLPGAPMVYYGDEYGEWGGSDPNNRVMWRGDGALNDNEQATLARAKAVGTARKNLVALRRGTYQSIASTEDTLLFARDAGGGQVALVALSHTGNAATITATIPPSLGLAEGTLLHDRLGGADVRITGGAVNVPLSPRGAAILAP